MAEACTSARVEWTPEKTGFTVVCELAEVTRPPQLKFSLAHFNDAISVALCRRFDCCVIVVPHKFLQYWIAAATPGSGGTRTSSTGRRRGRRSCTSWGSGRRRTRVVCGGRRSRTRRTSSTATCRCGVLSRTTTRSRARCGRRSLNGCWSKHISLALAARTFELRPAASGQ